MPMAKAAMIMVTITDMTIRIEFLMSNLRLSLSSALTLVLLLMISGCCCTVKNSQKSATGFNGSWKLKDSYQGNTRLSFHNGNYEVDFDGDGQTDVWGHYELNWNEIVFTDKRGKISADCRGSGQYTHKLSGDELKFTLIADSCAARVQSLGLIWIRMVR